ncbi:MAG: cupredoxin domain-containing protein [Candidatus Moranbacteria bacterium]|nr:cupredoxin domain-containing protein [Candidatus Moranbacteria bacterium]
MKKLIIILLILGLMEGIVWWVYRSFTSEDAAPDTQKTVEQSQDKSSVESSQNRTEGISQQEEKPDPEEKIVPIEDAPPTVVPGKDWNAGNFPPPSTEVVNGVTERTIHIGVRQWAWDPPTIVAKKSELVRFVIHNADVKHGLVIPDLGVNQDIPEDGAVVEFIASKVGTFEFFCSVWCGEGHMEMRGKIVVE